MPLHVYSTPSPFWDFAYLTKLDKDQVSKRRHDFLRSHESTERLHPHLSVIALVEMKVTQLVAFQSGKKCQRRICNWKEKWVACIFDAGGYAMLLKETVMVKDSQFNEFQRNGNSWVPKVTLSGVCNWTFLTSPAMYSSTDSRSYGAIIKNM
jgi:hypothetical protein